MSIETLKVYELAKEFGLDSFTLIDKLKDELGIEVKSHMSSVEGEQLVTVRAHFLKPAGKGSKTKTTVAKATKTASPRPAVRKAAAPVPKPEAVVEKKSAAKASPTVIRRRAKTAEEEAAEMAASAAAAAEAEAEAAAAATSSDETEYQEVESTEGEPAPQESAPAPEGASTEGVDPTAAAATTPAAPPRRKSAVESIQFTRKADPVPPPRVGASPTQRAAAQFSTSTPSGLNMPTLLGRTGAGKMAPRSSGLINIVKDDPRKPLPVRPGMPGARPPVVGPGRFQQPGEVVSIGKEAIDKMVEEEQSFKKKTPGPRGEREKEPTVNILDYRAKKEIIFLPKKKKVPVNKELRRTEITKPAQHKRVVKIENAVSVAELADRMGIKVGQVIQKLIAQGVMATVNQTIDLDTATLVAQEYGYEVENVAFKENTVIPVVEDKAEDLKPRPPVVTVMGHVDHGKTSLLDAIRSANVAAGEAGGITQHIGAYTVTIEGKEITFIDTPGHEAFTMMRARGANVTDLVILVVAADDGVMPQTREAVDHARAAGVPIIVAVNKVDKPGANPDKAIKGLSELNLLPEAWGGDTMFINVSALKRTGIKELLEAILLQAEVLDLKANPDRLAEATVLEAKLDRTRGVLLNILMKKGTLKIGDPIVAGNSSGRVRALVDDKGRQLKSVGPGYAVEMLGMESMTTAGDSLYGMESESAAGKLAEHRISELRKLDAGKTSRMTLEEIFAKAAAGQIKELPLILKTDVTGSAEAIRDSLLRLATEKVKVKILSTSTGGISESDVLLASASNAIILGFNVRPETKAKALAESESIEIKTYSVIYELIDDVKAAMAGVLEKKAVERYLGRAEVRNVFSIPKLGMVAGCSVVDGKILRAAQVRVLRDSRIVYTGKLASLKRFKDDAKEVAQGYECGLGVENYNDVKVGDVIEAFAIDMVAQDIGTATATGKKGDEAKKE